ncbi:MAG: ABC transporter permease [Anaerolineae bacterium]|nr:ABC transporter permease [Anaerolineae bacterium]
MDIRKILTIAWKDIYSTFTDRSLLLIMIAAPLALTAIIGAAFSGFTSGSNDVPIQNIETAVVNEDEGAQIFISRLNYGDIISSILVPTEGTTPDPNNTLWKLIKAQKMTREQAIEAVNTGKITAAILIPKDFSASLNPLMEKPTGTTITLYRDAGAPVTANIVSSVVRGIVNQITAGNVAVFAAGEVDPLLKTQAQQISEKMQQAGATPPISVNVVSVSAQAAANSQSSFNPLQYFAPSMAVFFLTFTMLGGASSIIEEQKAWTLQRLISSPTSSSTVLAGKLAGTYGTGLFQLSVLIVLMSLLSPILGAKQAVWGNDPLAIALLTVITVLGATGLGSLIAALARTPEQANTYGSAFLTLQGLVGGAFFNVWTVPVLGTLTKFTINYWAVEGYTKLANGGGLADVLPNMAALLVFFVVGFGIAIFLFNRRIRTS